MGGVVRNRRLVSEKPEGGLITGLLPETIFPGQGSRGHFPTDADVLILSGLYVGPARWALNIPCTHGQVCSDNYFASVHREVQPDSLCIAVAEVDPEMRLWAGGLLGR